MFDSILAFGDSTTAGFELIADCMDWDKTKELSFPNQLANKFSVPCYNYAWPGGSNDRSFRLLPEKLLEHKNSLVLFTYTMFDRTEFFLSNFNGPDCKDQYRPVGVNWSLADTSEEHQKFNRLYLKYFYESRYNFNNYKEYNMILNVQLICEQFANNYLQIFLYPKLINPPVFQKNIFDTINKSHLYRFDTAHDFSWETNNEGFGNLQDWARWHNYEFCPGKHIGQEAHDNFANTLYNYLT
jgi:hypothetical protein